MYIWHTHWVLFHSVVWCMYTGTANSNFHRCQQNRISFSFFAYSRRPLLDNAGIYTSTLILCNSLNYSLIDTKLGTMLHLLLFYHSFELHGLNYWYHCCTAWWYANIDYVKIKYQKFFYFFVYLSILMYFTGARFVSYNLMGTADMVIFVLLCKIIHSFMHANMLIIK